ncbi:non-canonical purine NTP pyrophosphatase [Tunturiibacter lichenicola]|uniref:non-canonical purine NTP pyrophosphatase n=1 Tax=Tunturiibacter lichenicola TaxID=2051959 RepID=UPI003D9B6F45
MRNQIRFVSNNPHKLAEARDILEPIGIAVEGTQIKIEELQTEDTPRLVHDKLLKAFGKIGRPLFVEHTGLYLEHLNGLPGGLTQIFWDTLQADRFSELFGKLAPVKRAIARTTIAYCDGQQIYDLTAILQESSQPNHVAQRNSNGIVSLSPRDIPKRLPKWEPPRRM